MPHIGPLVQGEREVGAGGAESQIWLLVTELARRGRRVAVVTQHGGARLPREVQGVSIVTPNHTRRLPTSLRAILLAWTLAAVGARITIQRSAGAATGLAAIAARLGRSRFIYSSSSVVEFDLASIEKRRLHVALFHLGARLASAVVVQTPEQVDLCRARFRREPVMIKSLAEEQPLRSGEPEAFLWVGRLVSYKQPEAFVELASATPDACFRMVPVATGPDEQATLARLRAASAELTNLELLAPRPRKRLGDLIARSVAIVSTTQSEGMPNVFLEGWARGVPALALRHDPDGVIEREGIGGFAEGSQDRLAQLAETMWAQRGDQTEVALRCRDYVAREHSIGTIVDRWEELLGLA